MSTYILPLLIIWRLDLVYIVVSSVGRPCRKCKFERGVNTSMNGLVTGEGGGPSVPKKPLPFSPTNTEFSA